MRIRLHVVIDQESESLETEIRKQLLEKCPTLSFSPSRPQPSLKDCLEFYGTAELDSKQIDALLAKLNNDWDQDEDDYEAYGFNTLMFHPHVYYLHFQIL